MEAAAGSTQSTSTSIDKDLSKGIEWLARAGYAAKGVVYAVIGVLAVRLALGAGGDATGSREALGELASAPFGMIALGLVTLGLVGYAVWRMVQAFADPEAEVSDDSGAKRWAKRSFYFASGVIYLLLAYYGATLVLGGSGGGTGGGGGSGGGGPSQSRVAQLMSMTWGAWLVGAVGVGIICRGLVQFAKVYTSSFKERIRSFDLGPAPTIWTLRASRMGLTARGIVFALIGGSIVDAAATRDPGAARGLEGVLEMFVTRPWLLGAMGVGLFGYAVFQWVKARYRLIGT